MIRTACYTSIQCSLSMMVNEDGENIRVDVCYKSLFALHDTRTVIETIRNVIKSLFIDASTKQQKLLFHRFVERMPIVPLFCALF